MADFLENQVYDAIQIGQIAELQRVLTRDDIALFSKVSGDLNPTHMDEEYARARGAKGLVAMADAATATATAAVHADGLDGAAVGGAAIPLPAHAFRLRRVRGDVATEASAREWVRQQMASGLLRVGDEIALGRYDRKASSLSTEADEGAGSGAGAGAGASSGAGAGAGAGRPPKLWLLRCRLLADARVRVDVGDVDDVLERYDQCLRSSAGSVVKISRTS
jgi:hypothetical protein